MDATVRLAVPETVAASYVVATPAPVPEPVALARQQVATRIGEPLRELVLSMIDSTLITVQTATADQFPAPPLQMLGSFGATADQLAAISAASHLLTVRGVYQPGWPPVHEWAARAIAGAVAAELDAPLIDAFTPRVMTPDMVTRSLPDGDGHIRLVDWVLVPQSAGPRGWWFTTVGLARFGLPELQTVNVPPQLVQPWTSVISGIGHRLMGMWAVMLRADPRPTFTELPELITVTAADVRAAYAVPGDPGGDPSPRGEESVRQAVVRLRLAPAYDPADDPNGDATGDPAGDAFLTVVPPDDYAASAGEFMAAVCAALFGRADDEIRRAPSSDAMDEAIAEARARLPQARDRFTRGDLPTGGHLIVKHRLALPGGNSEYVWAYVTSWTGAGTILGTCANDAEHDHAIRVGRPVTIPETDVADWAIWLDGQGIIEGGWTNRVL